jgi:hypothetical protein
MEPKAKLKPGKWLYLLGALIIVVGIVVTAAFAAVTATQMLSNKLSATVPGQTDLNLTKTGTYVMTYDYNSANGGKAKITNLSDYSGLKFTLTEKSDNSTVSISTIAGSAQEFKVTSPGTYTLSASYGSGSGPSAVMMIISAGQSAVSAAVNVIFFVCLIAGVVIIIVTAVKRKKYKKQLEKQ